MDKPEPTLSTQHHSKTHGSETQDEKPEGFSSKVNEIIPVFFYDVICRIIPGLLVLVFCYFHYDSVKPRIEDLTKMKWAETLIIPVVLCVAWAIGVTFEAITNIGALLWYKRENKNIPSAERNFVMKYHAESAFFRSMCLLSCIVTFLSWNESKLPMLFIPVFIWAWVTKYFEKWRQIREFAKK